MAIFSLNTYLGALTWVRAEAFPVTATLWAATKGASNRSELDCNSLSSMLAPHSITSGIQKPSIKGGSYALARREDTVEIRQTDTHGAVLHTQRAEPESGNGATLTNTLRDD